MEGEVFLWKKYFNNVDHSLSNIARRGLRPRAFNVLCNLLYAAIILVADRDLMGSAKMAEEL